MNVQRRLHAALRCAHLEAILKRARPIGVVEVLEGVLHVDAERHGDDEAVIHARAVPSMRVGVVLLGGRSEVEVVALERLRDLADAHALIGEAKFERHLSRAPEPPAAHRAVSVTALVPIRPLQGGASEVDAVVALLRADGGRVLATGGTSRKGSWVQARAGRLPVLPCELFRHEAHEPFGGLRALRGRHGWAATRHTIALGRRREGRLSESRRMQARSELAAPPDWDPDSNRSGKEIR